jgi:hypothetical protein
MKLKKIRRRNKELNTCEIVREQDNLKLKKSKSLNKWGGFLSGGDFVWGAFVLFPISYLE